MTKGIIAQGAQLDKLRANIAEIIEACKKHERKLSRQGCQSGAAHFKTSKPNCMFIYEPQVDGHRKYVHVGVDPDKQKEALERIDRFKKRDELNKAREDLERQLSDIDWQLRSLSGVFEHVDEYARLIHEKHVKRES